MLFMLKIVYTLCISHDRVQCNLELEIAKLSMTKGASFQHMRLHTHTCMHVDCARVLNDGLQTSEQPLVGTVLQWRI